MLPLNMGKTPSARDVTLDGFDEVFESGGHIAAFSPACSVFPKMFDVFGKYIVEVSHGIWYAAVCNRHPLKEFCASGCVSSLCSFRNNKSAERAHGLTVGFASGSADNIERVAWRHQ